MWKGPSLPLTEAERSKRTNDGYKFPAGHLLSRLSFTGSAEHIFPLSGLIAREMLANHVHLIKLSTFNAATRWNPFRSLLLVSSSAVL